MFYVIRQGFSIKKDGVFYTGGQSVELTNQEFELHKHKFENVAGSVFPNVNSNPGNGLDTSVVELSLNANTWTDFASALEVKTFEVLSFDKVNLTDSFEYRQFESKWQIFSLISQNNLQIILQK